MDEGFPDRGQFLNLAALVEGGLAALAFALGWLLGVEPLEHLQPTWAGLGWGLLGAAPLVGLFFVSLRFQGGPLGRIQRYLVDHLGSLLDSCRWYDLVLLATAAGLCEELLFRGVLQPWLEQWGPAAGLLGSNLIFGAAHAVTSLYAVLAGGAGLYFGVLLDAGGERNLLVPVVAHAAYDYVAFVAVARMYRRGAEQDGVGGEPE